MKNKRRLRGVEQMEGDGGGIEEERAREKTRLKLWMKLRSHRFEE